MCVSTLTLSFILLMNIDFTQMSLENCKITIFFAHPWKI